ncbi:MAG: PAS domain-containing protein [bacterium]|nr:PAS domain-containing protein [bacterium]MDD5354373.1 PAS domain-containing protein [bacterium]MDD5756661.1 PAS domain-containing protein [bacterium]
MDNNKIRQLMLPYTLLIFILIVVFEFLKTEIFIINNVWLAHILTIIFVTLMALVSLVILKSVIARQYQELIQELHNANISAQAANQELQATNQELRATEDELRSTNDELIQQKQDLDIILKTMPEGIIRTEAKGKVLFCNDIILEETGLNREDLLNKDIKNIVLPDDRMVFAKEFEKVFTQGAIKEVSFHSQKGTQVLADIVALKDKKNQVVGTISAIRVFSKTGKIIEELDNSRKELSQKIEEMRLLHRTTIDREKRIIELKEQVDSLKQELAKNRGTQTV